MASPSHLSSRGRADSTDPSETTGVTSVRTRIENFGQSFKERERGESSKRRKTLHEWTSQLISGTEGLEEPVDDGYSWRMYGQQNIPGTEHPRFYFQCTHCHTGCPATKKAQRFDHNQSIWDVSYHGVHTCQQRLQLVSPPWEIEQRESQELHPPILVPYFMTEEEEEATTAPPLKNQSPPSQVEFASSLKVLGWFVQLLFDNCLTAIQDRGVITDKPDPFEALESLLDELNSVQAMLSLAQNFGGQHGGLLELLKDLMDAAYETDDLLSEVDYYRLEQQVEQQVDDSEDEDLLRKVEYRLQKASISSTLPSFHDDNKVTIVRRIHEIVSRLDHLVTRLSEALSLLEPEEVIRANPNVFPVASHPLTTSFLLSNHGNLLEDFPESEFLSRFNKCAFGVEDPSDHLGLGEIAKQIAGKLNGSSLAAKIVGGLLRDNLDEQHWRSVLCSDIWQQRRSPHDIMPILRFSYHHLPAHLQQCFAYCGIFPKNYELEKEKLVGMWISQGYIHTESGGSISPEEIGSEYLDNLVSKSFIQASNHRGMALFVLHELLHDLAEYVLKDECLRIDSNGTAKITNRVRHIYARQSSLGLFKSCNLRNLRTLILCRSYAVDINGDNALTEVLNGLKSIRVLSLGIVYLTDFRGIFGHLIHLRYLTVRANIQSLWPDNCRLYHLQWLIIGTLSSSSQVLPAALNWLVSLRHFEHRSIIYGIGNLTHLQWLSPFSVGKNRTEKLGQLNRLNELRGTLKLLSLQHASTKEEALEANLNRKIGIRELELNSYPSHASPQMAEEVFEGLQPPPYIKKLTLYGYNGVKSPSWMMTENNCVSYLQSLCLQNCPCLRSLPVMPPSLQTLSIRNCPELPRERYRKGGDDWHKISHVPTINWQEREDLIFLDEVIDWQEMEGLGHLDEVI